MSESLERALRRHVAHLAGEIGERHVWRPVALRAAETYIRGELISQGHEVARQPYVTRGVESSNLEVCVGGRAAEIILIGAHYDTVPGCPGADDNASGVAALIELARSLSASRPARTIRLVAFVNEEPPFFYSGEMGSQIYARAARKRGDDIRMMLSLEMLGCYSERPGSQAYPPLLRFFYPDRGNFIGFVSNIKWRRKLREVVTPEEGHEAEDDAENGFRWERDTTVIETPDLAGDGTQQAPIALGTVGDTITFSSYFDGWGYVHLFRNEGGKMTELDTYAIPEAHDPAYARGFGDLSVHEVATSQQEADRLYFSYYAGGFRVAEIENDQIVEKGHYIDANGNNFWGVQVFEHDGVEYVAASDRDHGLWIFRYTP